MTPRHAGREEACNRNVAWLGVVMNKRGWGGRPSKGDRDQILTRPSVELGEVVRAAADDSGMSISEYVAKVLAEAHGLPELAPQPHPTNQGELPIAKGGARLPQSA